MANQHSTRGRPRNVVPTVAVHVQMTQPLYVELNAHLYSDLEERVPHGALSEFINQAVRLLLDTIYKKPQE